MQMIGLEDTEKKCWATAVVIGVLVALLALAGHRGFFGALLLGIIAAVLLGLVFKWLFCAPVPKLGARPSAATNSVTTPPAPVVSATAPVAASEPKVVSAATDETATEDGAKEDRATEDGVTGAMDTDHSGSPVTSIAGGGELIKPSKPLAGQDELAARKGSWKYKAEPETHGAGTDASDVDDAAEDTIAGTQPVALSAPRDSGADNLKEIKGVGPKLEELLHDLGVYHFDQIAAWSATEVAWMDSNLKGFRGRVSRDDWTGQARILAEGGETEFSSRVDKGGVY